jgi:Flp pilus assembly pilin Flp
MDRHLAESTALARDLLPPDVPPRYRDLVRFYYQRGGVRDFMMLVVLVPLTLGLSAWWWARRHGSCAFAGVLDEDSGRVGCLIHPARVGMPDARRHAFPLVPSVSCNRDLVCGALNNGAGNTSWSWFEATVNCARTLPRSLLARLQRDERGDVAMEYVILTTLVVLPLLGAAHVLIAPGTPLFDPHGAVVGTDFGALGNEFRHLYQRIVAGVAMPVP